jgi:hypothetical protein
MTAPNNEMTTQHWVVLERLAAGENPAIPPLMRRKLRRMDLIVAVDPPRARRLTPGRQKAPAPRQHALTESGRVRLGEHRLLAAIASAPPRTPEERHLEKLRRHIVAESAARHSALDD